MKKAPGLATVPQALVTFSAAFAVIIGMGIVIARAGLPLETAILATPAATLLVVIGAVRVFRLRRGCGPRRTVSSCSRCRWRSRCSW